MKPDEVFFDIVIPSQPIELIAYTYINSDGSTFTIWCNSKTGKRVEAKKAKKPEIEGECTEVSSGT